MELGLYGGAEYDMGHRNRASPTIPTVQVCLPVHLRFAQIL